MPGALGSDDTTDFLIILENHVVCSSQRHRVRSGEGTPPNVVPHLSDAVRDSIIIHNVCEHILPCLYMYSIILF